MERSKKSQSYKSESIKSESIKSESYKSQSTIEGGKTFTRKRREH
jgi:hypothetical protein